MSPVRKRWKQVKIPKPLRAPRIHARRIPALKIPARSRFSGLVGVYSDSGSFQAGRIATACRIYRTMLKEKATICLTLAGAMTPTGMGGLIAQMIEKGGIDWIVATGANVFHDLAYALGMPMYQGHFRVDDAALNKQNIDRIYDIFLAEEVNIRSDVWLLEALKPLAGKKMSTAEFHYALGKALLEDGVKPENSMVAAAAKYDVPIYTSSPGDSEIGMNLGLCRIVGFEFDLDPIQDVVETTAIVNGADKNGVVIVGGGSPKNFFLQTQPMLKLQCGIDVSGHDYDIQITIDSPHWGGLSGATPEEAVSWGKIKPDRLESSVVVYSDTTIAVPIIFGYTLEKGKFSGHKRLMKKLPALVSKLKKETKISEIMPKL